MMTGLFKTQDTNALSMLQAGSGGIVAIPIDLNNSGGVVEAKAAAAATAAPALPSMGAENPVIVQLTEEQLQLLISAEHLTHEVIQAHQQSSLNEITPELRHPPPHSG